MKPPKIDYNTKAKKTNYLELIIILLLFSIGIRALIGLSLVFSWKINILLGISLIGAIVLGKAFGGILGDKFGWIKIAITGLLVSAPLLAFGHLHPLIGILGALFFNLTMPITLVAISNSLPGRAGFAFGLTTLALLVGTLLTFVGFKTTINTPINIISILIISAIAVFIGLKLYYKNQNK
jgi:FSR family fosmidomycin resistance protein-like MFS transporter